MDGRLRGALGANHRGGWFYQLMAVVLTYLAICSTYTPDVLAGMREGSAEEAAAAAGASDGAEQAAGSGAESRAQSAEHTGLSPAMVIFAFIFSLGVPFLLGFENIIGILILGFGLYQAWVMNKKAKLDVSGPYAVAPAA